MAYIPSSGSVVAFQSDATKLVATVSVSGVLQPMSVAALQGTNPWFVQLTSGSVISSGGNSSVQVVGLMPPQSVSGVGTFNIDPQGAGSIIAKLTNSSVTALQGTNPWIVQLTSGSVITTVGNSSVQVVGVVPTTSVIVVPGIGVLGSVATLQGTNPWISQVISSVAVTQTGNGSIVTVWKDSSVLAGLYSTNASIVGTYAEDSAHTTNDKGVFSLQVRNDTMSSITSTDGDYSPQAVGPVGEVITANSPITKWTSGVTSVMYGTSVAVISAPGASIFTYISGLHVTNESANLTRVTFTQGAGSVIAFAIAPASGGSNMIFPNPLRMLDNRTLSASISGVSSVYITAEGFVAKI